MKPSESDADRIRCMCQRRHEAVLHSCGQSDPPYLDCEEVLDPHVQFVVHMRHFLEDAERLIKSRMVSCGRASLTGKRYEDMFADTWVYAHGLACMLSGVDRMGIVDFCFFAMVALCTRVHGFFGHAMRSMFASKMFSSHMPLSLQDPAVWMLTRAIFSTHERHAGALVRKLASEAPHVLPALGMLCLVVRTQFSFEVLLEGGGEMDTTSSPVFKALASVADPVYGRTPVQILLCAVNGSEDFGTRARALTRQLRLMIRTWATPGWRPHNVDSKTALQCNISDARLASIHKLARSDCNMHGHEWMDLSRHAAWIESTGYDLRKADLVPPETQVVWIDVWQNARHVLLMSRRVIERRRCKSVAVVWFYSNNTLLCFSRSLKQCPSQTPLCDWASNFCDSFENALQSACNTACVRPEPPTTRHTQKEASNIPGSSLRWNCGTLPLDHTTECIVSDIRKAVSMPNGTGMLCVGQGAFRKVCAFATVSYREDI